MENKNIKSHITINKVYTRSGDQGTTRLVGGQMRNKSDKRVQAYGEVDELNSIIGGCVEMLVKNQLNDSLWEELIRILIRIQHELFNLGTVIATLPEDKTRETPQIHKKDIMQIETEIDRYNRELSTLHSFVLPGGSETNIWFHLARTVCRRTERVCVELSNSEPLDKLVIGYLNRLSDALFVWSRWVNKTMKCDERLWEPFDKRTD